MALLASWAWALAGCLAVALAQDSGLSALYPPLWDESPGQFSDYRIENGKYIINPWVFTDRMGMYRILLSRTAKYFARFAPENEQNILWGLPLQHGWQYKTGRLADPTRRRGCGYSSGDNLCISVDSWWADINYYLSVLPFLAAVDSGILGISSDELNILPPPTDQTKFCYDVSHCRSAFPKTMNKWKAFFQYMQSPLSDFEGLLQHLWDAHTSSLDASVGAFEARYAYYFKPEASFGENWAISVNYLAAARLPTTLIKLHGFQNGLPSRILSSNDTAPFIDDFTPLQNKVLVLLQIFGDTHKITASASLSAWKLLMSTQASRNQFLKFFETFLKTNT